MSELAGKGALEVLEEVRAASFPTVPPELLAQLFELETEAQFDAERGLIVARIRDLVTGGY